LERGIERDLRVTNIEKVLPPQFDGPALIGSSEANPGIHKGEAFLSLCRQKVRSGVVFARGALVDVE